MAIIPNILQYERERRKQERAERKRLFQATMIRRSDIQQRVDAALQHEENTHNAEKS